MTATALLLYIGTAIILQVLVLGGVQFLRYRTAAHQGATSSEAAAPKTSEVAWAGWREFRVASRVYEDLQRNQCSFYLKPVDGVRLPAFKPGQFLTFQLPLPNQVLTRCYSLSDRPSADHYRITIKRQNAPLSKVGVVPGLASNQFHDAIQMGDVVRVLAPSGSFFIDPDPSSDVVLIAGGIGITPLLSMLLWCIDEQPKRGIYLYYGVHDGDQHVFKAQLAQLAATHPNFHPTVAYSQPRLNDELGRDFQLQGHVDMTLLKNTLPRGRHQFYLCGPAPMMESLVSGLVSWGVASKDIHFEAFGPASIGTNNATANASQTATQGVGGRSFEVQFLQSARTLLWTASSGTLLSFAEKNAINIESGCRVGNCGACETQLISGSIRYAVKPSYDVAIGNCLLCVSVPSTNVVLAA